MILMLLMILMEFQLKNNQKKNRIIKFTWYIIIIIISSIHTHILCGLNVFSFDVNQSKKFFFSLKKLNFFFCFFFFLSHCHLVDDLNWTKKNKMNGEREILNIKIIVAVESIKVWKISINGIFFLQFFGQFFIEFQCKKYPFSGSCISFYHACVQWSRIWNFNKILGYFLSSLANNYSIFVSKYLHY